MTRILVGIDGSECSKAALQWACEEAATYESATVVAMAVWFAAPPVSSPWLGGSVLPIDLRQPTTELLDATIHAVPEAGRGSFAVERRVVQGPAAPTLVTASERCDLVVVGTRGLGGFKGLVLGSVSHQLVNHAHCPVVVVPLPKSGTRVASRSIVVGVDGSDNACAALRWAARRAQATRSTIRATLVWQRSSLSKADGSISSEPTAEQDVDHAAAVALDEFVAEARVAHDVTIERVFLEGPPAKMLIDEAREAQLLVVGARGREGFVGLLLGSVANAVTQHPPCPVAVIRNY